MLGLPLYGLVGACRAMCGYVVLSGTKEYIGVRVVVYPTILYVYHYVRPSTRVYEGVLHVLRCTRQYHMYGHVWRYRAVPTCMAMYGGIW